MILTREQNKTEHEYQVLERFLDGSGIPINRASIMKGDPGKKEPDFICCYDDGENVGIELGRITDPNIAKTINRWKPINGEYVRTSDPSRELAKRKLRKQYNVPFSVELLFYKEYPIITPDNIILPALKSVCRIKHCFARVWFMGGTIEILYECS